MHEQGQAFGVCLAKKVTKPFCIAREFLGSYGTLLLPKQLNIEVVTGGSGVST